VLLASACFADSEAQAEKQLLTTLVAAMALTDQQIYSHLDKLVVSMLSPVLLDVHFMMDICDEDADDDGG